MSKYVLYLTCYKCGKKEAEGFSTKRDRANRQRDIPNPYYCYNCDPTKLHGDEKLEFAKSLIGTEYFPLYTFRSYSLYTETIQKITHIEVDQTVTYSADGETTNIGWTRVYHLNYRGEPVWESPDRLRKIHLVTDADKEEIVNICKAKMDRYWGYSEREAKAGYTKIINEITSRDDYYVV